MVKSSDSGRDLTVELLPAGDPFGLGVALAWDPYPVTVKAQITSEILWIPRFKIFEIFDAHPSFSKAIMKDIFDRLRSAHNLERGLAHDRTDVRVATALLALAPRFQKFESHSPNNCIPMTREQLGECIGCATETVVRVTKDWERRGIVDLSKRGKITVLNTDELEEAAGINF
jgi:CRP-like cAMP-binding protein